MSDRKITIKPYRGGSLGLRVFLISLALLIFPLFLHTFFLYRREYRENLRDVKLALQMIGEGQKALLEERIEIEGRILDATFANYFTFKEYFKVIELDTSGSGASISPDGQSLFVKKETSKKTIAITTPLSDIFYQLLHFENASYKIAVAFVNEQGKVLAGEKLSPAIEVQLPIEGADFSLFLTASKESIDEIHVSAYIFRLLSFLFFVGGIGGFLVYLLMKRVSRPLKTLYHVMERVGEGAVHVRYVKDAMGFEINTLGQRFNQMIENMLYHAAEAEAERISREKLAEELRIGHEIQHSLLPSHLPEFSELDIGFGFLPAKEVGGDFYDVFQLSNGSLFLVIADTAGKGVSACLYSLGLRSILRTLASSISDLSEIILRANDLFIKDTKNSGMFITLWAAIYDLKSKTLTYCSQGHPPGVVLRDHKTEELWTPGIPLGIQTFDVVTVKKITLKSDDLLFLYTDGVIEAHDPDQELFGRKRLFEFLLRSQKLSANEIKLKLLEELTLFSQNKPQSDDIAVLSVRVV